MATAGRRTKALAPHSSRNPCLTSQPIRRLCGALVRPSRLPFAEDEYQGDQIETHLTSGVGVLKRNTDRPKSFD